MDAKLENWRNFRTTQATEMLLVSPITRQTSVLQCTCRLELLCTLSHSDLVTMTRTVFCEISVD